MNLGNKSLFNYEQVEISKDRGKIKAFSKRFDQMWVKNRYFRTVVRGRGRGKGRVGNLE